MARSNIDNSLHFSAFKPTDISNKGSAFDELKALPKAGKPITSSSWHSHDEAFFDVVEEVGQAAKRLNGLPKVLWKSSEPC